ncbi:hypothetical protein KSS87_022392, partial [Heliosperma pusillum]
TIVGARGTIVGEQILATAIVVDDLWWSRVVKGKPMLGGEGEAGAWW